MSTADNSDRRVTLEDPSERWAIREGYLTEQTVWWNESGSNKTTQHLTPGELQAIVNQAASRYDIRPECTCPDDDWDPDCPTDGTAGGKAPYCTTTMRDGYGEPWACFLRLNHKGYCGFQRTTSLPEGHPERGRA